MNNIDTSICQQYGICPDLWATPPEIKVQSEPESEHIPVQLDVKLQLEPESKLQLESEPKLDLQPEPKLEVKPESKLELVLESRPEPEPEPCPQERVQKENKCRKRTSSPKKRAHKKKKLDKKEIKIPARSSLAPYPQPKLDEYHKEVLLSNDNFAEAVVQLCSQTRPNLETIKDSGRTFIITSWLSIARIFEASLNKFIEVRRLPQNRIDIVPNIITNLHIDDYKLHLGYCWGHHLHPTKSYIEIRNLLEDENNLTKRIFFDQTIDSIYSDSLYLYVILSHGLVHIHKKELHDCNYQIDYSIFGEKIGRNVVAVRVLNDLSYFAHISRLIVIAATHKEIIISRRYMDRHELISCNIFENSELNIISMDFKGNLVIIVRRTGNQLKQEASEINLGYIRTNTSIVEFALEYRLQLRCSVIKTLVTESGHLIIFTRKKKDKNNQLYEVACLWLPKLQLIWVTIVEDAHSECAITAIDQNNIIIAKTCQDFINVNVNIYDRHKCPSCDLFFPTSQILELHKSFKHLSAFKYMKIDQDKTIRDSHSSALKRLVSTKQKAQH